MGDLHHRHGALITQGVQPIDVLTPQSERGDIALAIARILDRGPTVFPADLVPDQGLEPVHAVDHDGAVIMFFGVERGQCAHHFFKGARQRKAGDRERAQTIFGLDEHGTARLGCKGGFTDTGHTVNQDARRLGHIGAVEL